LSRRDIGMRLEIHIPIVCNLHTSYFKAPLLCICFSTHFYFGVCTRAMNAMHFVLELTYSRHAHTMLFVCMHTRCTHESDVLQGTKCVAGRWLSLGKAGLSPRDHEAARGRTVAPKPLTGYCTRRLRKTLVLSPVGHILSTS